MMSKPSILFPTAKPGEVFRDVMIDNQSWIVFYERVNNKGGFDVFVAESFYKVISQLSPPTTIRFRDLAWNKLPNGVPVLTVGSQTIYPGGVLDASSLFSLLLAEVEPKAIIEFRVTGEGPEFAMKQIKAWFEQLNPESGLGLPWR